MAERIKVMLTEEEVDAKIREIGEQISKDYEGKEVHLICVLKGGSFFMCELAKRITVPVSFDFMSVSSYGAGTSSSGVIKIVKDLDDSIMGKDVIVVEDIVDTGLTMHGFITYLKNAGANSVEVASFLFKPEALQYPDAAPKYIGMEIPTKFVLGYGLDYDEKGRNYPALYVLRGN